MADRRPRRLAAALPAAAVCAVLLVVAVAARSGTPLSATAQPLSEIKLRVGSIRSRKSPTGGIGDFNLPGAGGLLWVVAVGSVLVLLLLLVGLLLALRAFFGRPTGISRRRRDDGTAATPDAADAAADELRARLRGEVAAGLEDLDETGDPRRAVIACWLRLERAVAEAGTPRRRAETPADLVTRVLAEHRVRPAGLQRLSALYREARYSRHELDEGVRGSARAALDDVRRDLSAVPG
jgi:hypothetical protein